MCVHRSMAFACSASRRGDATASEALQLTRERSYMRVHSRFLHERESVVLMSCSSARVQEDMLNLLQCAFGHASGKPPMFW